MQINTKRRTHQERTDSTRASLITAARRLFTEKGYANTTTPEIVLAAQVTRGALYHHFIDKADLFFAVALQCAQEVADRVDVHAGGAVTPVDALLLGAQAYFLAMAQEGRARLLLIEAAAVLTAEQRLQINELSGEKQLQEGLAETIPATMLSTIPLPVLASLVSAAFDRAALAIATGGSQNDYQDAMRLVLSQLTRPSD